jgi:hypothetical protein
MRQLGAKVRINIDVRHMVGRKKNMRSQGTDIIISKNNGDESSTV